jgi:putative hydrolase of the HAD superfamily
VVTSEDIDVIAFDADDTLWVNESNFQEAQKTFAKILHEWVDPDEIIELHYETEKVNLPIFGYGIKGFTLSLIETAIRLSKGAVTAAQIQEIILLGKSMLNYPIELLPGTVDALKALSGGYRLIVATKGDLLDQERKLERSGLSDYFHHVEVMSEKNEASYRKLIAHLDIASERFLMIGNALKSDILPVLALGGYAIHIPFEVDWIHEKVETFDENHARYWKIESLKHIERIISC